VKLTPIPLSTAVVVIVALTSLGDQHSTSLNLAHDTLSGELARSSMDAEPLLLHPVDVGAIADCAAQCTVPSNEYLSANSHRMAGCCHADPSYTSLERDSPMTFSDGAKLSLPWS
jgi:hypothetical protein